MGEQRARRAHCCAALGSQTACLCVLVFDILTAAHAMAYSITRLSQQEWRYSQEHAQIQQAFAYEYFWPLLILLAGWALTMCICLLALRCTIPYLVLPYLSMSIIIFGCTVALMIYSGIVTGQLLHSGASLTLEFSLFLGLVSIFGIIEGYSISVKYSSFKSLVKRKKAVQGTNEKPAIAEVVDPFESFSRRSTIIISDDFFEPPPQA